MSSKARLTNNWRFWENIAVAKNKYQIEVAALRNPCVTGREKPSMRNWRIFRSSVLSMTVAKATEYRFTLSFLLAKLRLQSFTIKFHRKDDL